MAQSWTTATRIAVVEQRLADDNRLVRVVGVAVIAVVLAGSLGWWLRGASAPTHQVTVDRTFAGTVSLVNSEGNAGCVKPDSADKAVCSVFVSYWPVHKGDKVGAAHEWVHMTGGEKGNSYDLLVLYRPSSVPQ